MRAVDFICGPAHLRPNAVGWFSPVHPGGVLSDHAGYWIDF
jgi:hypothetical protein